MCSGNDIYEMIVFSISNDIYDKILFGKYNHNYEEMELKKKYCYIYRMAGRLHSETDIDETIAISKDNDA